MFRFWLVLGALTVAPIVVTVFWPGNGGVKNLENVPILLEVALLAGGYAFFGRRPHQGRAQLGAVAWHAAKVGFWSGLCAGVVEAIVGLTPPIAKVLGCKGFLVIWLGVAGLIWAVGLAVLGVVVSWPWMSKTLRQFPT